MLVFHAAVSIDPDSRETAVDRAADMAAASRREAGVLDYRVAVDVDDRTVLRFFEQFEDEAAFEAHLETDHYRSFVATLPDVLAGEPEITRFEVEAATDVDL